MFLGPLCVSQDFGIPGTDSSVSILFIDTILLAGLTHPTLRSRPPDGPASIQMANDQWKFINQTLATWAGSGAENRWRIVVGHYPGNGCKALWIAKPLQTSKDT